MKTKQRVLLALLAAAVLLCAALWAVTRSNAKAEQAASAAAEGGIPLSTFAAEDLEQIEYTYNGQTYTLQYSGGSWQLAQDPAYHLDESACNTMRTALMALNAKRSLTPQAGEIRLSGRPLSAYSRRETAEKIAYIPQSSEPIFNYTVIDTVLMGTTGTMNVLQRPGRRQQEAAVQALQRLGIEALAQRGEEPVQLRVDAAQHPGVVVVGGHAPQAEQHKAFQAAPVGIRFPPEGLHVVVRAGAGAGVVHPAGQRVHGGGVKVHVGNGGEQPLHQQPGLFRGRAAPRRDELPGKRDERPGEPVLCGGCLGRLAAHPRCTGAGGAARRLLTLKTKHLLVHTKLPFCHEILPVWAERGGVIPKKSRTPAGAALVVWVNNPAGDRDRCIYLPREKG